MRLFLVAPVLVAAASVAVVVDAIENGVRGGGGRNLVQGDNQRPCDALTTGVACQWGVNEEADVRKFWISHENVFWRCHKPGLIALTFDDGPSENMGAVLDELKAVNVTATFFINGENIQKFPEYAPFLTRAEQEGHVVAHHTWNHQTASKRVEYGADGKPTEAMLKWFELQFDNNVASAHDFLPLKGLRPYFRPPYLDLDEETSTYLEDKYNIYVIQISSDTRDFEGEKTSQVISDVVTGNVYAQPGDVDENSWIFLQHDKIKATAGAVPKIFEFGRNLGYEFVGIDECLGFPHEERMIITSAPTPMPCDGEPCALTYQCRSRHGFCGTGPEFCDKLPTWLPKCLTGGIEVQFNCSATACDSRDLCRSGSGYCGSGDDYCNENSVWLPACDGPAAAAGIALGVLTVLSGITAMLI